MSRTALVVVDVLSTYDHEDADRLAETAREALPAMRRLLAQAGEHDVLTVYVNDNFGVWNAGRAEIVEHVRAGARFAELVEPLLPDEETAFVVKARHSIFFETPLAYLLTTNAVCSSGSSGSTSSAKRSPGRTCSTISARPAFQTPKLSLT